MICLAAASGKRPADFYSWNEKGAGYLNIKNIDIAIKGIERSYSSRLNKKIKCLIFEPDSEEESYSISESLQDLD